MISLPGTVFRRASLTSSTRALGSFLRSLRASGVALVGHERDTLMAASALLFTGLSIVLLVGANEIIVYGVHDPA